MSDPTTTTLPALAKGMRSGTCPKCRGSGLRHAPGPAGDVFHCPKCKALPADEAVGLSLTPPCWPPKTALDRHRIITAMAERGLRWQPSNSSPVKDTPRDENAGRWTPDQIGELLKLAVPWDKVPGTSRELAEDMGHLKAMGIASGHPAFFLIPRGRKSPEWFKPTNVESGKKWDLFTWGNFRLLFPLYDATGQPRGVKVRPVGLPYPALDLTPEERKERKTYAASKNTGGLILACDKVVAALSESGPWPAWVLILEGEKDHAAALARWSHVHKNVGFIGIFQGSISKDWVSKIPESTQIVSMVDPDAGGDGYHAELEKCRGSEIPRIRPTLDWPVGLFDTKNPPDVADCIVRGWAPEQLDLARVAAKNISAFDPDELLQATLAAHEQYRYNPATDTLKIGRSAKASDDECEIVCSPVPMLEALARDIQTGETVVNVSWRGKGSDRESHRIHGATLSDPKALAKALSAQNISISARHHGSLADWIMCQRLVGAGGTNPVPTVRSAQANGWWNIDEPEAHAQGPGFLLGKRWCGRGERVRCDDSRYTKPAARISAALQPAAGGSFEAWCLGMQPMLPYPVPQLHVLCALASPLLSRVNTGGSLFGNIFPRGTAKTFALQIGLSTFARPDVEAGALQSWTLSIPGIEQAANYLRHLALCLDDTATIQTHGLNPGQEATERAKRVAEVAFLIVNGMPRLLAAGPDHGATGGWRLMTLFTGEVRPDFRGQMEGAEKRFIAITCHPWQRMPMPDEPNPVLMMPRSPLPNDLLRKLDAVINENAGHVMPTFIDEVLKWTPGSMRSAWAQRADHHISALRDKVRFVDTIAGILAVLDITYDLLLAACKSARVPCPVSPKTLPWLAEHLKAQHHAEGVEDRTMTLAETFLAWSLESRDSGMAILLEPTDSSFGWKVLDIKGMRTDKRLARWELDRAGDPADLYFMAGFIDEFLRRHPSPQRAKDLIRSWLEAGFLEPSKPWTGGKVEDYRWSKLIPGLGPRQVYKVKAESFSRV